MCDIDQRSGTQIYTIPLSEVHINEERADNRSSEASNKDRHKKYMDFLDEMNGQNDLAMRKSLKKWALVFVAIQLLACDVGMGLYMMQMVSNGLVASISDGVLIAWMSSSLVEVIGILWVIARNLFPFRDNQRDKVAEKEFNRMTKLIEAVNKH